MAKTRLTDVQVRSNIAAFSRSNLPSKKIGAGEGLYLFLRRNCDPVWRVEYEATGSDGKRKRPVVSLGNYPEVTMAAARESARTVRTQAERGDPVRDPTSPDPTFGDVAKEWYDLQAKKDRSAKHLENIRQRVGAYLLPTLGGRPVAQIRSQEIRTILDSMFRVEHVETAKRTFGIARQIFTFAKVHKQFIEHLPTEGLQALFGEYVRPVEHMPAIIEPKAFGGMLREIDAYPSVLTRIALQLLPLVVLRPGREFTMGKWREIDFADRIWRVPPERMKKRNEHWVPLSKQAISLLERLKNITSDTPLLFPSATSPNRSMSNGTLTMALKRMGLRDEQTAHGFRASFQTIAKEQRLATTGAELEALEVQLAHARPNQKLGYDRTAHLETRVVLMQRWADYLDKIKMEGAPIESLPRTSSF